MAEFKVRMRFKGERIIVVNAENSFDALHKARNGEGEISDPTGDTTSFHIMKRKEGQSDG